VKRYRFPLGAVLRVRKIEEDQAVLALAEAERRRVAAEELAALRAEAHRSAGTTQGALAAHEFLAARERRERSAAAVLESQEEVAQARMATIARRAALAAAAAAVGALEHLDEKARAEHALETQREVDLEVDDLVTSRHRRGGHR
jgi:flagellar export protein FliJ